MIHLHRIYYSTNRLAGVLIGLLAARPLAILAQEEGGDVQQSMTITELFHTGGVLMYVLAAMSVMALAFVIYFFVTLRQDQVTPQALGEDLREALAAGKLDVARNLCKGNNSALAAVTVAALDYTQRVGHPDPALLKEIIEGEGSRQAVLLQNQTTCLQDIAVISPMVGLLGTVIGMLKAFNVVALDLAKAKPMLLAAGVSQALITTAAGLIVGIPAMAFFAYFRGRSSKLLSNLETASVDLLTLLVQKKES